MYQLFAFHQAEESEIVDQPGGHYDPQQQLWIADETSHARGNTVAPIDQTKVITRGRMTAQPDGSFDGSYDVATDVKF